MALRIAIHQAITIVAMHPSKNEGYSWWLYGRMMTYILGKRILDYSLEPYEKICARMGDSREMRSTSGGVIWWRSSRASRLSLHGH